MANNGYVYELMESEDPSEDKLKPVFRGGIPNHYDNPLLVFINAFLQGNASTTTYRVVYSVQYSTQPPAILLIIASPPDSKTSRAYLCESTHGYPLAFVSRGLPYCLPLDMNGDLVLDANGVLDLTCLPGGDFRGCLQNFEDHQMESMACIVCATHLANTWFVTCGHMVTCKICARRVHKCPTCRVRIPDRGRFVLPDFLRTSNWIPRGTLESTLDTLEVLHNDPGWILSAEQLADIIQSIQSQHVLSKTFQYVMQNMVEHGIRDKRLFTQLADFMTDVVLNSNHILQFINTNAWKTYEIQKYHEQEYTQGPASESGYILVGPLSPF